MFEFAFKRFGATVFAMTRRAVFAIQLGSTFGTGTNGLSASGPACKHATKSRHQEEN